MIRMAVDTRSTILALADQCVMCGLCLPFCPTYGLDGQEAESPRGRIALAAALARGTVAPEPALRLHLDHCLGCMGCERVCPANVKYGDLLVETRALLGPGPDYPHALTAALKRPFFLRLMKKSRMGALLGRLGRRRPARSAWGAALGLMPRTSYRTALPRLASANTGKTHVAIFPGCVASVEDADAQRAAELLLGAAGFRVSVLPALCCGAMDAHGGLAAGAARSAAQVREAWTSLGAERLVTVTPGCLSTLRRALPETPVDDATTLIAANAASLRFKPLNERVALHIPCTQANVARSDDALRRLLQGISGVDLKPLPAAPYCCGAAGTHMLEFPERAAILRDEKLDQVAGLAPDLLLSSNIGCRLHLAAGMSGASRVRHLHPLTLLARQLETS
jgi:glycolate oxidase iron-sulfur subunit